MLLTSLTFNKRNSVGDGYRDIVNQLSVEQRLVAVVPNAYAAEEFAPGIACLLRDPFAGRGRAGSLREGVSFARQVRAAAGRHGVGKAFFYFDNDWFNVYLTAALGRQVDYYAYVHDPLLHSGEGLEGRLRRVLAATFLYPRVRRFFVSYTRGRDELARRYRIDPGRITVLRLPEMRGMHFPDLRAAVEPGGDCPYDLIFFGRLERYKGWDLLLDSLDILRQRHGLAARLLVVGRGQDSAAFTARIAGRTDVTHVAEYLSDRALAELITRAKVVVLPYRDATGSQTVQIANYYRKPVIATPVGGFPDYVEHLQNGLLLERVDAQCLAEACRLLLEDRALQARLGETIAASFERRFGIDTFCRELASGLSLTD